MRYLIVDTIGFVDANGVSRPVKDMREIPAYPDSRVVAKLAQDDVDEISSRETVYGAGAEGDSYRIWEANAVGAADANYDLSRLAMIRIPS